MFLGVGKIWFQTIIFLIW